MLSPFSLPPVDVVRGENFTISWHISGFVCSTLTQVQCQSAAATCKWSAGSCQEYTSTSRGPSISNPATRRPFVMITQEACPATLTGRRSFLQGQFETLGTAPARNAAGAPCPRDAPEAAPPQPHEASRARRANAAPLGVAARFRLAKRGGGGQPR